MVNWPIKNSLYYPELKFIDVRKPILVKKNLKFCQVHSKGPKTAKWVILKGDGSLVHIFHGYERESSCSGLLTCKGTLWNQSEAMRTSKEPSRTSQRVKNSQMGDFQRWRQSWRIFSRLWEGLKLLWTYHVSGYPMEPIRGHEDFQGAVRNV